MTATAETTALVQTPDRLIALAIEHGADVDRLGKLMDLQERWQAGQARMAYFDALSRFQSACPAIPKSKQVKNRDGSKRYAYAPLDTIIKTLREPLQKHGFSYRWQTDHAEDSLRVTCYLMHAAGHEESAVVTIPGITGHGTNAAQDEGSAITYGRRYSLINVLGIVVDEDDDGAASGPAHALKLIRQSEVLRLVLPSILTIKEGIAPDGDKSAAAEAYAELTLPEIEALWIAPTKGGIWTVEERRVIKSDQEFQRLVHEFREARDWHANPENQK